MVLQLATICILFERCNIHHQVFYGEQIVHRKCILCGRIPVVSIWYPIKEHVGYVCLITDRLGLFLLLDMHTIQLTTIACIPDFSGKLYSIYRTNLEVLRLRLVSVTSSFTQRFLDMSDRPAVSQPFFCPSFALVLYL